MRESKAFLIPLLTVLTACASATMPVPAAWRTVPHVRPLGPSDLARYTGGTPPVLPPATPTHLTVVNGQLMNGSKPVTDRFQAIQSFDVSEARGEVIFSAKKNDNFDIGIASTDGTKTNWLPADPADEVNVVWAPRGNKVSYTVRARSGDAVRTLHIPTSAALTVPFPLSTVHALAWEPAAERYAVIVSSAAMSPYVELVQYSGEVRRTPVGPEVILDADVEPFGADGVILTPRERAYGERLPLVLWLGDPHAWNDAVGTLFRKARVAILVVSRITPEIETRMADTPWLDPARMFLVGGTRAGATSIVGDPLVRAGRYVADGNVVRVAPDDVESLAAGYIADRLADRLKRNPPTNGSSR
jgi:hypothetical protein